MFLLGAFALLDARPGLALSQAEINHLTRLGQHGDVRAQYKLGKWYQSLCGRGQKADALNERYAAHWFYKAALQGHREAQFSLAFIFEQGTQKGVPHNPQQAAFWYEQAAQRGHVLAQLKLGEFYDRGIGVEKDHAKAHYWRRKGAKRIKTYIVDKVRSWLGLSPQNAKLHKEAQDAVLWFRSRADRGDPQSQYALGLLYARGIGVPQNHSKAIDLLGKAAKGGIPHARAHQMVVIDQMIRQMQKERLPYNP